MVVPGILVGSTQGKIVAHGMTHADTHLPRSVQAEVVIHSLSLITHCIARHIDDIAGSILILESSWRFTAIYSQIVGCTERKIIEHRRIDVCTDAERRLLYRTEDDTSLHVISSTRNLDLLVGIAKVAIH